MASMERIDMDGVVVLRLHGTLTTEGVEALQPSFVHTTHQPQIRAVIDLTDVDMLTTPAISMFISASIAAKNAGGQIIFTEASPPVRDVLKRLRLHSILKTVPGLDKAVEHLRDSLQK
jgi:anti-anti-sigma factor